MASKDEVPTPAWVTDMEIVPGARFTFIRLVERGAGRPASSHSADFVDIDLDAEGNIIGITIPAWDSRGGPGA